MANVTSYCIGIDGGGSRTRGVLYHDDKLLSQTESGTVRVGTVGVVESAERILNLIRELCTKAQITLHDVDAVTVGLAGVWLPAEQRRTEQLLRTLAREKKAEFDYLKITSDAAIALEGAFAGKPGIVLIVGTGSIAIGKKDDGSIVRCGGWGIELSDEGSGAWIGREGLATVLREYDGRGEATALKSLLLEKFPSLNPDEPRTFIAALNDFVFDFASLSPLVMQCAEEGDALCKDIIERAATHLVDTLEALARKHFSDAEINPVACMGGIMETDTILSRVFTEALENHEFLRRVTLLSTPLDGAVEMARAMVKKDTEGEDL